MRTDLYHIISDTSEDRFGETDSFEEAVRIAQFVAREGQTRQTVLIEHQGKVIRQLVLLPDGRVAEEALC